MPGVGLVVTDLDGTLWRKETEVHERTVRAWAELHARGIPLLVATGRRLTSAQHALARLGWHPPVVALDGALGCDLSTGERFYRHRLSRDDAVRVLAAFSRAGLEPCVYVDHPMLDVFVGSSPSTHPGHLASLGELVAQRDLDRVVADEVVLAFGLIGCAVDRLRAVVDELGSEAQTSINRSFDYGGGTLMVVAPGLSKWDGVLAYCAASGCDPTAVLAIGDGPNDLELLRRAKVSLSLTGSAPEALALADHVVAPVEEGGWAELLSYLG